MNLIATARLDLVPVTASNAGELWSVMQSPHLREFQDVPRSTREEFVARVARRPRNFERRAGGRAEWLIVPRAEPAVRKAGGWISLRINDRGKSIGELGYSLIAALRGRGYGREATAAILAYAFTNSIADRLEACCVPANVPSRALLARLGFEEEKLLKRGAVVRGRAVDILLFALTRERWQSQSTDQSAKSIVMPASANP